MPRTYIEKYCPNCNKIFYPLIANINRGYGKFCSVSCAMFYRWKSRKKSRISILDEFLNFINTMGNKDNCWLWEKTVNKNGYAILYHSKSIKLHRYSYEYFNGKIENGLYVCHKCDIRNCINPNHLFLGTHKDNMDDMIKKDRHNVAKGESHYCSKLKCNDIYEIKIMLQKGIRIVVIAKKYHVSPGAISKIKHNRSWGILK